MSLGFIDARKLVKGLLIILSGALIILPAYLNYLIFTRLHFQLVVSLSITLILFALGVLVLILAVGIDALEGKR